MARDASLDKSLHSSSHFWLLQERNETFSVHLSNPTGGARLGTQQRTIVTIIDDDKDRSCSSHTFLSHNGGDSSITLAGVPMQFTVNAVSCSGQAQTSGGDVYMAVARKISTSEETTAVIPTFVGSFLDVGDGTYQGSVNVTSSGHYQLDVYLLVPGGLKGSYFTDAFLSTQRLDFVRTDAAVNFTFGTGPITTFGRDFASVRWEGVIMPEFSEIYTFWLDIDDQARLWIDDELIIDLWDISPSSPMGHAECELRAYKPHEILLEYRDITGNATAKLLWSSQSTPLSTIPSTNLFYKEKVDGYNFTVHPALVSAGKSKAIGQGVHWGIAGKDLVFTIMSNDAYDNFRGWPKEALFHDTRHLDNFQSSAILLDSNVGEVFVPVTIFYNDTTRTYEASYTPVTSGLYLLNVTIDSQHIFGSPFTVDVQPGATFAPQSLAYGGYDHGMAGKNSTFFIDSYDSHRNKRNVGGDEWSVTVSSVNDYSDYHYGSVNDFGNGTYAISVMPIRSGLNELQVKLNGSHIKGSPFKMEVVANEVGSPSFAQEGMIITALGDVIIKSELIDEDRWDYMLD